MIKRQQIDHKDIKPEIEIMVEDSIHPAVQGFKFPSVRWKVSRLRDDQEHAVFRTGMDICGAIGTGDQHELPTYKSTYRSKYTFDEEYKYVSGHFPTPDKAVQFIHDLEQKGFSFGESNFEFGKYKIPEKLAREIAEGFIKLGKEDGLGFGLKAETKKDGHMKDGLGYKISNLTQEQAYEVTRLFDKNPQYGMHLIAHPAEDSDLFKPGDPIRTITGTVANDKDAKQMVKDLQDIGIAFADLSQLQGDYQIPQSIALGIDSGWKQVLKSQGVQKP